MAVVPKLGAVVINVLDYDLEKAFWSALLDVEVAREFPGMFVWFEPQAPGGISVALQKAEMVTDHPNRLHLDTAVSDLDESQARIEELGGSHIETHEIMGFSWRVMADPEGNEFCIAVSEE